MSSVLVVLVLCGAVLAVTTAAYVRSLTAGRARVEQTEGHGAPPAYAQLVAKLWPDACRAADLGEKPNGRKAPRLATRPRPMGDGYVFRVSWPGWQAEDIAKGSERLGSWINARAPVGMVKLRVDPNRIGEGELIVSRTHPLASVVPWPAKLGEAPAGGRGTWVVIGRTEHLTPALYDLARTGLWAGQNGSGKTVGVTSMLLAAAARPDVEITVYDASVKLGADYLAMGPRLRYGRVLTERRLIVADLHRIRAALVVRSEMLGGGPWSPSRRLPLRLVIVEEFPSLELRGKDLETLTRLAQQGRALGFAVVLVSQSSTADTLSSQLRGELRQRVIFRMEGRNAVDTGLGHGVRGSDGEAFRPIPAEWPGVFDMASIDEGGVVRCRAFLPQSTMAEALAWSGGSALDVDDPSAVGRARLNCYVAAHVAACPRGPRAADWRAELTAG